MISNSEDREVPRDFKISFLGLGPSSEQLDNQSFDVETIEDLNKQIQKRYSNQSYECSSSDWGNSLYKDFFNYYSVYLTISRNDCELNLPVINSIKSLISKDISNIQSLTLDGINEDVVITNKNSKITLLDSLSELRQLIKLNQTKESCFHTYKPVDRSSVLYLIQKCIKKNIAHDFLQGLKQSLVNYLENQMLSLPTKEISYMGTFSSSISAEDAETIEVLKDWNNYGHKWLSNLNSEKSLEESLQSIVDDFFEFSSISGKFKNAASRTFIGGYFVTPPQVEPTLQKNKVKAKLLNNFIRPSVLKIFTILKVNSDFAIIKFTKDASSYTTKFEKEGRAEYVTLDSCEKLINNWVACINSSGDFTLKCSRQIETPSILFEKLVPHITKNFWDDLNVYANNNQLKETNESRNVLTL